MNKDYPGIVYIIVIISTLSDCIKQYVYRYVCIDIIQRSSSSCLWNKKIQIGLQHCHQVRFTKLYL